MKSIVLLVPIFLGLGYALAQPSTNGMVLWLDSSHAGSVLTNSAGAVTAWVNDAPGTGNLLFYSGNNDNNTSASFNSVAPTLAAGTNGYGVVNFGGLGYLENLNLTTLTPTNVTVFLLACAQTNPGNFSAFMAFRLPGANDYQTGLNIDQGLDASTNFDRLNVEGAKAGGNGGFQFANGPLNFGTFYLFEIDYGGGDADSNSVVSVLVDGIPQQSLVGTSLPLSLDNCYIGTRADVSGGGKAVVHGNHDFIGQIAAVLVYDHQLAGNDYAQTLSYLNSFFAPPNMSIVAMDGNDLVVSWPNRGSFKLQESGDLAAWTDSGDAIDSTNWVNTVTIAGPQTNLFFRLTSH